MRRGPIGIVDHSSQEPRPEPQLASWYSPGLSDGWGDRLLMFDNTSATALELLRFKPEFTAVSGFEAAIRRRLEQLESLRHPSMATIRALKWLGEGEGLALISNQVEGRRLSEVIDEARGPGFAVKLLRQLTPTLALLHEQGDGIAHGMVTPERVVIGQDGRLVLVEHVLGAALQWLNLPPSRLRRDFGIAIPDGQPVVLDSQSDVVQLALIALSLTLGRRVNPDEYPSNVPKLLEEAAAANPTDAPLMTWLERALGGERRFASASEAALALNGLPDGVQTDVTQPVTALVVAPPAKAAEVPEPESVTIPELIEFVSESSMAALMVPKPAAAPGPTVLRYSPRDSSVRITKPPPPVVIARAPERAPVPVRVATLVVTKAPQRLRPHWLVPTLTAAAIVEAVIIIALITVRPSSRPPPTAAAPPIAAPARDSIAIANLIEGPKRPAATPVAPRAAAAPAAVSTVPTNAPAPPPTAPAPKGQLGRLSVNAEPFARVWIDGRPMGWTPLGNLSLPLGEHQIVFRHPQFGERRQTAVVTADGVTQVTANLQR